MFNKLTLKVRELFIVHCSLFMAILLSGCVVRTYELTRDRVDQDLAGGNRGYLKGKVPSGQAAQKSTRTTQVVEIELRSPIKFEKMPKETLRPQSQQEAVEKETIEGNRGYITKSNIPEMTEPETKLAAAFKKYTVQKGDTLQKISQKFYGTTKKWLKIYDANKDTLKGPNKVYPGQVLNIPASKEPKENLK